MDSVPYQVHLSLPVVYQPCLSGILLGARQKNNLLDAKLYNAEWHATLRLFRNLVIWKTWR